jgi:Protein of unknown function (DUF3298)/Deacetylase PdaC
MRKNEGLIIPMRYILIPISALLVAACGGSTGSGGSTVLGADTTQAPVAQTPGGIYSGVLNSDTLVLKLEVANKVLSGSYFVKGTEDMVTLSGSVLQGDTAEVYEFSKTGDKGGVFKGLFKGDVFTGNWQTLPNGEFKPFAFTKSTLEFDALKYAGIDTLAYETIKKTKKNKAARCTISIDYPQLLNPDKKPELTKINSAIKKYFEASLSDCDGLERDEFTRDLSDFENETGSTILYNHKKIFGVSLGYYSYLGGAHPNHGVNTYYFDITTGRELKLVDLVQGPNLVKLSALATAAFKKDRKVKSAVEGGLFEEQIRLKGTESFYITDKGITLAFSPYEIAPYAVGDIEIAISLADLKPLITQRSAFYKVFSF